MVSRGRKRWSISEKSGVVGSNCVSNPSVLEASASVIDLSVSVVTECEGGVEEGEGLAWEEEEGEDG